MSNSTNCQNDEMSADSTVDVSNKNSGQDGVKNIQSRKNKDSAGDEAMETEETNDGEQVDGNDLDSEQKNGISAESKVTEIDTVGESESDINKTSQSSNELPSEKETECASKCSPNSVDSNVVTDVLKDDKLEKSSEKSPVRDETEKECDIKTVDSDVQPDSVTSNGEILMEVDSTDSPSSSSKTERFSKESSETPNSTISSENTLGMSPELIVSDAAEAVNKKDLSSKDVTSTETGSENKEHSKQDTKKDEPESSIKKDVKSETSVKKETSKAESSKKKKSKICEECGVKKGLKFQVFFQGKQRFFCSDKCITSFKSMMGKSTPETPSSTTTQLPEEKCAICSKDVDKDNGFYPAVGEIKSLCSAECLKKYHDNNEPPKNCAHCAKNIVIVSNTDLLRWETMVYCNDVCLGMYQNALGAICTCCQSPVDQPSLGKYCVCFGSDIRQFCSGKCLEDYKKGLKVCTFCQTDLSTGIDSFVAPVGEKKQFKDFCSQLCMERYENMNSVSKNSQPTEECSVCKKTGSFKIQLSHENTLHPLCSDTCVSGFRYVHKIKDQMCDSCYKFFTSDTKEDFSINFDGQFKQFCSKACMTLFTLSQRKIVPCVYCKVKKYNFDMIRSLEPVLNQSLVFCSVSCLISYRAKHEDDSNVARCQNCSKNLPVAYNLTMSDGSKTKFCCYSCVLSFQNKFLGVSSLASVSVARPNPVPVGKPAASTGSPTMPSIVQFGTSPTGTPVLAGKIAATTRLIAPRQTSPIVIAPKVQSPSSTVTSPSVSNAVSSTGVYREVVVKPPPPKSLKNKTVSVKPVMHHKGINCKPTNCHKAVQTDPRPIILPIPVPIYIPTPMHMFSRPVPCPVPFPVPVPVPIVLPTSKESQSPTIKNLKDIHEKLPTNPYEAELLVMAEMVAEDGSKNQKDSSKDESDISKRLCDSSNAINNSDLQLGNVGDQTGDVIIESEPEEENITKENKRHRHHHHHKRKAESHEKSRHKKCKIEDAAAQVVDRRSSAENDAVTSTYQNDQPETFTRLKHMFGVNAWKHWVLQKNKELEKARFAVARKHQKYFKTDPKELIPDELNCSMSLFIREIRKPNGEEYSAGSIYYLCLGIQQYLLLNGRVDNIFFDHYYDKFTSDLNEILQNQYTLSPLEGPNLSLIEEEVLWESKQLGAHSPHVLLNTLMYFNTKFFKLKTVEDHLKLSFSHITKHWERPDSTGQHRVLLRYFPSNKDLSDGHPYEQKENLTNPLRCPVKLYEFYLSKCPENVRSRNDIFYLSPEHSCVPDSPVWYSSQPLHESTITKMVHRIKVVREVNT